MIIGINGYAKSGKDTIGKIIQYLQCQNVGDLTIKDIIEDYPTHQQWLEQQSSWEIKKFAGKLKTIASILTGIPAEEFENQKFKSTFLSEIWSRDGMPMTVREFLQRLGTDGLREGLHTNTWVNALVADYKPLEVVTTSEHGIKKSIPDTESYPNWIITDTRFINEARAIKNSGGYIIRVNRPECKPVNDHPSEVNLDSWNFDYVIQNNGGFKELADKVLIFLEHINAI